MELLTPYVEQAGYELVHVELQMHRPQTLRVYIDLPSRGGDRQESDTTSVGVEDCANVSRALDAPLESLASEIDTFFGGAYELEVSSPGVDRPLRRPQDFDRFAGRDVRIHTFRPLTADEMANADYQKRNPKQKNYLGILEGFDVAHSAVKLAVLATMGSTRSVAKPGAKVSAKAKEKALEAVKKDHILIPMTLITKANIEPDFNKENER